MFEINGMSVHLLKISIHAVTPIDFKETLNQFYLILL